MSTTVEIYTQPGCLPCTATMRRFDQAGVPYKTVSAPDFAGFLRQLGHTQTPVVIVNSDLHWSGYRPDAIDLAIQAIKTGAQHETLDRDRERS